MKLIDEIDRILPIIVKITARKLSQSTQELSTLNWHKGESNIDVEFSELAKNKCIEAFDEINSNKSLILSIEIPDLLLTFRREDETFLRKIELKSTKSTDRSVPGSMIMSLDPNMWTIFCLRLKNGFEVKYGRYYLGMSRGTHDLFQDRSPRPRLKFDNYQSVDEEPNLIKKTVDESFYKHYAQTAVNRILNPRTHSWQDNLVKEIIKIVLKKPDVFKDI